MNAWILRSTPGGRPLISHANLCSWLMSCNGPSYDSGFCSKAKPITCPSSTGRNSSCGRRLGSFPRASLRARCNDCHAMFSLAAATSASADPFNRRFLVVSISGSAHNRSLLRSQHAYEKQQFRCCVYNLTKSGTQPIQSARYHPSPRIGTRRPTKQKTLNEPSLFAIYVSKYS